MPYAAKPTIRAKAAIFELSKVKESIIALPQCHYPLHQLPINLDWFNFAKFERTDVLSCCNFNFRGGSLIAVGGNAS